MSFKVRYSNGQAYVFRDQSGNNNIRYVDDGNGSSGTTIPPTTIPPTTSPPTSTAGTIPPTTIPPTTSPPTT